MIKIDHLQKECGDAPGMGDKIWDKASSDGVFAASPLQGCWVPKYMHVCQASGRQGGFPSWEQKLNLFPFQDPTYGRFDSPQVCLHIFSPSLTRILQQERGVNAASSSLPAAGLGFHMGKNIREALAPSVPGKIWGFFFGWDGRWCPCELDTSIWTHRGGFWGWQDCYNAVQDVGCLLQKKPPKKHGKISSFYPLVLKKQRK